MEYVSGASPTHDVHLTPFFEECSEVPLDKFDGCIFYEQLKQVELLVEGVFGFQISMIGGNA